MRPRSPSATPARWVRACSLAPERVGSGGSGLSGAEAAAGIAATRSSEEAAAGEGACQAKKFWRRNISEKLPQFE